MGRVASIERRKVETLAAQVLPALRDRGSLMVDVEHVADIDRWRRAARLAGRQLGCRVRTGVVGEGARVWAVSLDHEVTEGDLRRVGLAVDAVVDAHRSVRRGRLALVRTGPPTPGGSSAG
jgi:hypothetical protein